jgi:polar amino acid transport system substrate-binding protein
VRPLLAAVLLLASAAQADTIETCVSDIDVTPYTFPDHDGQAQYLIRRAAAALGDEVRFRVEPRRRCVDNVLRGRYPLLPVISSTPSMLGQLAYPMRMGRPDPGRAIGVTEIVVVRPAASPVTWDGKSIGRLSGPVLYMSGYSGTRDRLAAMNVPMDDTPRDLNQMTAMLLNGRGGAAVMQMRDWRRIEADPELAGKLIRFELPLIRLDIYCAFNRDFARRNAGYVERFWKAIDAIRATTEWQELAPTFQPSTK